MSYRRVSFDRAGFSGRRQSLPETEVACFGSRERACPGAQADRPAPNRRRHHREAEQINLHVRPGGGAITSLVVVHARPISLRLPQATRRWRSSFADAGDP